MSRLNIEKSLFPRKFFSSKNQASFLLLVLTIFCSLESWADSHHPQEFLEGIKGKPNEGEQIVAHFCANCHALKPLIELGAPKIQQMGDWKPRLKKGMEQLFINTSQGINAMPPRGGCFECSDEQLKLAILVLLPLESKKPKK